MKTGDKKYALFGGSFDPPHLGHMAIAKACREQLELDEVIWVPNARNPMRRRAKVGATERLQMCQIMTDQVVGMAVSDIEVSRSGPSYTLDTVEEFLMVQPGQIWIIMGADSLGTFLEWKEPYKLARLARLAVCVRPGTDLDRLLDNLPEDIYDQVDQVEVHPNRASSTAIRDDIARGLSPELMLDARVWDYIKKKGLYNDGEH
jgi:nicotinate-nucleotide adenylyltransferase